MESRNARQRLDKLDRITLSVLDILALSTHLFACLMVTIFLYHAIPDGAISDLWAPSTGGNHGPWRHYAPARTFLDHSPIFMLISAFFAALSRAGRKSLLSHLILFSCANFFLIYLAFFFEMTD